ncbi:pentraxin-4 [Salvelinus alpinus]|uniref:pentraxin-4 n=1 Tax=Salvelinus alpinus TaxID=8036 RepID=UPI0039FC1244
MTSLRAGRRVLALVLLVVLQLQACRGQGAAELRKPIYQRLRRLDDQFRRFQEQTLSRLDLLSHMSNVSTSLEVRVQSLSDQHRNLTQELTQLRDTTTQELDGLKDRSSKLQKKNKRMEGRLASLERGLRERHRQGQGSRQTQRLSQEQGESHSSLTLELHSQEERLDSLEAQREELLVGLRGLQESLREQDLRMSRLEGRLGELLQGNVVSSRGSERTGDPLTSNLTPQDTAPPRRTQASRGQSPRQDTQTQPGHTQTYYQPQTQPGHTQTYYQPQPQPYSQPHLHLQPQPKPHPHPQPHSQPKHTKDRRMRTRLQPPPPHPTQPSQSQEERKRLGERGQENPRPGHPQQGPKPQSVEETREEGEMERRRGGEVWRRSEVKRTERRRGEEERTERRRGEEERTERRRGEEERTERRRGEEERTERRRGEEERTERRRGEEERTERRRGEEERTERREGEEEEEEMKGEESQIQNLLQLPVRHKIPLQHIPRREATICNVDSMLLFPSASSENYVTFSRSFPALPELSVCLWLRVDVGYVGTLLSYATEDNDNKLVLYGRNSSSSSSSTPSRETLDFVVGDPAYRELPVDSVLDGRWHHLCVLWSSIQGRFWHYTDRRLTSAGSRFRKGYEVPGGGLVVLGAEQDSQGGGFDPTEGFVGRLAGFTVWDRVLSPGEVTGVATGRGVPRGVVLELGDVDGVHGEVQQVACECLEHCS